MDKAEAAGDVPSEFIYDQQYGRFRLRDCPPILTMMLPGLTAEPEGLYDELSTLVVNWPRARVSAHSQKLFEWLAARFVTKFWVERSGLSYVYAADLVAGFPDARYVHLTRDGREVFLSMQAMRLFDPMVRGLWRSQFLNSRALREWVYFGNRGIGRKMMLTLAAWDRALTWQHVRARPYSLPEALSDAEKLKVYALFWAATTELGVKALAAIPADRLLVVRYEDLVASPRATLQQMITFLVPGGDHGAWLDQVAHLPAPRPSRWQRLDRKLADSLEHILGPVNVALGYE